MAMTPQGELSSFIKNVEMNARRVVRDAKRKRVKELANEIDFENRTRRLQNVPPISSFGGHDKTSNIALSIDTDSLKDMADNISGMREMLDKIMGRVYVGGDDKTVNIDLTNGCNRFEELLSGGDVEKPSHKQLKNEYTQKTGQLPEILKESPYLDKLSRTSNFEDKSSEIAHNMMVKSSEKISVANFSGELPQRIQATRDIIRKPTKSSTIEMKKRIEEKVGDNVKMLEKQGPICWDSSAIRSKYRGEDERESAWMISQSSCGGDSSMVSTDIALPVSHLGRHPLCARFYFHLQDYNVSSRNDTRSRNRVQQFSLDISSGVTLFRKSPSSSRLVVLKRIRKIFHQDAENDLTMTSEPYEPKNPLLHDKDFIEVPTIDCIVSLVMEVSSVPTSMKEFCHVRLCSFTPPIGSNSVISCVLWRISVTSLSNADTTAISFLRQRALSRMNLDNEETKSENETDYATRFLNEFVALTRTNGNIELTLIDRTSGDNMMSDFQLATAKQYKSAIKATPKLLGSIITLDELNQDSQLWESLIEFRRPNISMVACGGIQLRRQVPGSFEFGVSGMFWWSDNINARVKLWQSETMKKAGYLIEKTKPSMTCQRNKQLSSQESVTAIITMFIDSPVVSDVETTWDPMNFMPNLLDHFGIRQYSVDVMSYAQTINEEKLITELDDVETVSVDVATYDETESEPCIPPSNRGFRARYCKQFQTEIVQQPSYVFGVTRQAATFNFTRVLGTNVWHSLAATNYEIVRPRDFKDYFYIAKNDKHRGPNDPRSFTVRLHNDELLRIETSGFSEYEDEYEAIRQRKLIFSKKEALAKRIEDGTQLHESNLAFMEKAMRSDHQQSVERRMRQSVASERGWKRRLAKSELVGSQGQWQKRRDEATGAAFFHRTDWGIWKDEKGLEEKLSVTCQWECPIAWKGDSFSSAVSASSKVSSESSKPNRPQESVVEALESQRSDDSMTQYDENGLLKTISNMLTLVGNDKVDNEPIYNNLSHFLPMDTTSGCESANLCDTLLNNESFINALAQRLGLVEPLASRNSEHSGSVALSTDIVEDDDEPWTDSDDEHGVANLKELAGGHSESYFLPQSHSDCLKIRSQEVDVESSGVSSHVAKGKHVPGMDFVGANLVKEIEGGPTLSGHIQGVGWRKVSKPAVSSKLIYKFTKPVTLGPPDCFKNTPNTPICMRIINPVDGTTYSTEPSASTLEVLFITDIRKDVARILHNMEAKVTREREMGKEISTEALMAQFDDDEGKAKELTGKTMLDMLMERDNSSVKSGQDPTPESALQKAVVAVKNGDVAGAEEALEMDIGIDTKDSFGNTLFVLACQQGDQKMAKFLLRRGADINQRNNDGNTALHFCCMYSHEALKDYLVSKGADDTITNTDGLTCYEGLRNEDSIEYV